MSKNLLNILHFHHISNSKVDPKYVRNLKFTKRHNRVARKNLLKVRKAKIAGGQGSTGKVFKRVTREIAPKQASWTLSSILKNVTAYFTGETTTKQTKKRAKRTHSTKKAAKSTTTAAAKTTTTTTPTTAVKK